MVPARQKRKPRVGVFATGHDRYWLQFPGLKDKLESYQRQVEDRLAHCGADVVSAGLVDAPSASPAAADRLAREDVDLVICYIATYGLSASVLPIVQKTSRPVLVLNLQPAPALDYPRGTTADLIESCNVCLVPELSNAFNRCDIDFHVVSGVLTGDHPAAVRAWQEIEKWIKAASVACTLRRGRVGFLGHHYPGMLDMYADLTMVAGQLGTHIELLEMCDLQARVDKVAESDVQAKLEETKESFIISEDSPSDPLAKAPTVEELDIAARVACGLDRMVLDFGLDGLAYYYRGIDENEYERLAASLILGNTLLTGKGYPCSGEGDLRNCLAMLIMDSLGVGGSFTEFYAIDFVGDFLLMGHDGPGHIGIASGRPILRGLKLYHGKRGFGVSVEMSVRYGPITILGLTQTRQGNLKMLVAEGESIPGEILNVGNTNSRIKFPLGAIEFIDRWCSEGPAHHWAMGVGHVAKDIERVARLMKIELVSIC